MVTIECTSYAKYFIKTFPDTQWEVAVFQQFINTGSQLGCRKSSKLPADTNK